MKVYIAGPMTGYADFNRAAFNAAAERLRSLGYEVVNPAEMDEELTIEALHATPHHAFMRRDIAALLGCDLIYLLPGWKHSKGAAGEKAVADLCGIMRLLDHDIETWRSFEGDPADEPMSCTAACDEMHTFEGPCELAAGSLVDHYAQRPHPIMLHTVQPTKGVTAADLAADLRVAGRNGRRA